MNIFDKNNMTADAKIVYENKIYRKNMKKSIKK